MTDAPADLLEAAADLCARHLAGVNGWAPIARDTTPAGQATDGDPPPLDAREILHQREVMLRATEEAAYGPVGFPDVAYLVDAAGAFSPMRADRLSAAELAVAQVVEAAAALVLMRRAASFSLRITALERLRLMACELEALGGTATTGGR